MRQYLDLVSRILDEGIWVDNSRTGKRCKTIINADFRYDVRDHRLPILTTKKVAWKPAIAEFLAYLKGYQSAADFRKLGCNTWNANANENKAWLGNPARLGEDDMGRVYGVQLRRWRGLGEMAPVTGFGGGTFPIKAYDQLQVVYDDLKQGIDNRAEILTFWNPGEFHLGCLKACMHTHQFSLLDGVLYLHSYQRSDDIPLGHPFNQIQCGVFLMLMAQITNNLPGICYHKVVNAHIYEDQIETMIDIQLTREPRFLPRLEINPNVKTLQDVIDWVTVEDFTLLGYDPYPAIKYPFSV